MTADGLVLAFDTATESIAIAVGMRRGMGVETLATCDFEAPRAAMSGLLPAVSGLLAEMSLSPKDLSQVVVGRGPGSFTGVRIGVATAKGLAHGLGAPLFAVGTLDAISWGVPADWFGTLAVVGDAMRGEIYPVLFDVAPGPAGRVVRRRSGDCVSAPADTAGVWARLGEPMLLAGNGLTKYARVFTEALGTRATLAPTAWWPPTGEGLLRAFEASLATGTTVGGEPGLVLPVYTRLSDAEEAERAKAGLGTAAPPDAGVSGPPPGGADSRAASATERPSS